MEWSFRHASVLRTCDDVAVISFSPLDVNHGSGRHIVVIGIYRVYYTVYAAWKLTSLFQTEESYRNHHDFVI